MKRQNIHWYFLIFVVSGFSGLIYESIWTHYLKLFLGHAAYAQSLVLAIFMGGMAIGAFFAGRNSHRWSNLLLTYAIIEGAVGLAAFGFHPLFDRVVNNAYLHVMPQLGSPLWVDLFKWGFSTLLILPQSILLGMTFPLMSAGLLRRYDIGSGKAIAILYFVNSFGGAIGVLASGFIFIKWFGLPGTMMIAGSLNVLVALAVIVLIRNQTEPKPAHLVTVSTHPVTDKPAYVLLISVAFFTGFASFVYEIGWIRMLSLVLGSTTHAFELMLSAFILGLALGGLWIKNRIETLKNPVIFLGMVQIAMGLFALSTLYIYGGSFHVMQWLVQSIDKDSAGYTWFNLSSHLIAFIIMLPATFCAGMTLPLLTFNLLKKGAGEKSIGIIYSANTLGAILGVFAAIHLLMPLAGLKNVILAGSIIDIAAGIALLLWMRQILQARTIYILSGVSVVAVVVTMSGFELNHLKMASGVFRETGLLDPAKDVVLFHKDGKTASADLTGRSNGVISIRTNGKVDAGINMAADNNFMGDEATMTLAGTIPLLINPNAKTAANIGFGSGLTSHTLLSSTTIERVDTIEIEPAMVEAARGFLPRNKNVYEDERSRIIIDDAKSFFSTYGNQYDIIVSEPSNPWVSGVAGLFTREFYQLIKRQLTDQGLFVQWLQLYEIDFALVSSVIRAINENFEHYDLYASNHGDMLLIMSKQGVIPVMRDDLFTQNAEFRQLMARIAIHNLQDLTYRYIGNKQYMLPFVSQYDVPPNSDYMPYLDQHAGIARFMNKTANLLIQLAMEPIPMVHMLAQSPHVMRNTAVTPTHNFNVTEKINTATHYRDSFGKTDVMSSPLGAEDAQKVHYFNQLFFGCAVPAHGDKVYVLFDVMLNTTAYLAVEEFQSLWQRIEAQPCLQQWNARERLWYDFFKAVSLRASDTVIASANLLLQESWDITPARKKFLLAATLLAYLHQQDKPAARAFWMQHTDAGQREQYQDLTLFFMLLAHINTP